jgi:cobyrinic acid a,c-diamide synthase
MTAPTKAMVIAGTHSGVGKTTVALGIMAALKRRGLAVQPFKVGPDFIDPGHHQAVCGLPSRNVDGWMLGREYAIESFRHHCEGKDVAVIEGVMGLFDGIGLGDEGSTAQMARWLKTGVVLVVDARGMSGSVAALINGFKTYRRDVMLSGVILNRVGSADHCRRLTSIITERCGMPVIGSLPADSSLSIPERHLGLVTAQEVRLQKRFIERMAALFERSLDLDLLLRTSSPLHKRQMHARRRDDAAPRVIPPVRIGLARDRAFSFYYQDNLDMLRRMGATLVPFSPLRGRALPARLDGIYIGGGYPEVFAPDLEANRTMRREIKRFAEEGGVIYAECGGLMYLGKGIRICSGRIFKMAGIFPYTTIMHRRLTRLGYHSVRALRDTIIARRGECARGHQFRYSSLEGDGPLQGDAFSVTRGAGGRAERDGFRYKNVLAQYVHIHFGSNSTCAQRFVESCYRRAGAARRTIG